jgi:aryl-alcohol dehydrogenase-like predicted oxidoreductase
MTIAEAPVTQAVPQRRLGKTEERVPILGLGTGPGGSGLDDREAIRLYHAAIDRGVTYLDTAPGYGRAQSQLGEVMRRRRGEVFLVTKTWTAARDEALAILEKSLRELQTDCVDLVYSHCVGSFDPDAILAADGSLAGLREAQRRGWTRYVGFTAHHSPWKAAKILREAEVDVVMLAMNFADRYTYDFEGAVLPLADARDVGVAAMKVYGGAQDMNYDTPRPSHMDGADHRLALRYALTLPGVQTAVVGMYTERELEENLRWVQDVAPLSPAETARLEAEGKDFAARWGPHFGAVE